MAAVCPLSNLSTEELVKKITEAGIQVTEEEARKFRENDVDGEMVDYGLTEAMVGYLFDGSFKTQLQFQQFVRQYEEAQTIVILEPVPVESMAELQPPSTSGEPAHRRLPVVTVIPTFPKDVQARLDAKESCQKVPKLLNKIIRVLYEMMAEYTIECHKTRPDISAIKDLMARTFSWRRREIMEGMPVEDALKKYPYLRFPAGLFDEVDRIHPSTSSFCHRFRECFTTVLPNVLNLAKGKSHLTQYYTDARQEAMAEDLPGIDLRAGLVFLPSIFREKIEHLIIIGEGDPATPHPTI
ncbi:hypothetical protein IRJ41_024005 [Triplophysa rosa]|uniref:Uncharacterized protein n=1 Tax=Triplophysa rosa TaxID=992332 RepID=A0A9W7X672_TRIRA|nr:hypothetical protein IRJ41_024005 [Triplophysa rosa]